MENMKTTNKKQKQMKNERVEGPWKLHTKTQKKQQKQNEPDTCRNLSH